MIKLKYFDSIRHLLRSGKVDDPYVLKFTKGKVINGKTILDEIPDAMYKVRVTGYIEITKEEYYKTKNIPSINSMLNMTMGLFILTLVKMVKY